MNMDNQTGFEAAWLWNSNIIPEFYLKGVLGSNHWLCNISDNLNDAYYLSLKL